MTAPGDSTGEQPAVAPTVSTAPPPARPHTWWSAIPSHLGKARTSTLVLGLLFLAIGTLYLNVRPDPVVPATTGNTTVTTPAPTTGGGATTPAPTSATVPTTEAVPTTTAPTTTLTVPSTETLPGETTSTVPPTTTEPTTVAPVPTTAAPTG